MTDFNCFFLFIQFWICFLEWLFVVMQGYIYLVKMSILLRHWSWYLSWLSLRVNCFERVLILSPMLRVSICSLAMRRSRHSMSFIILNDFLILLVCSSPSILIISSCILLWFLLSSLIWLPIIPSLHCVTSFLCTCWLMWVWSCTNNWSSPSLMLSLFSFPLCCKLRIFW